MPERIHPLLIEIQIHNGSRESVIFHAKPEGAIDPIPILYAVGWGSTVKIDTPGISALAEHGKDVWSFNPVREGKSASPTGESFPEIEINKAQGAYDLLAYLRDKGVKEIDVVAHSEGAMYTTIAALKAMQEEAMPKIRSMVLIEPAGCLGKDSPAKLFGRFFKQAVLNMLIDPETREFNKTNAGNLKEMFTKTMPDEVRAISTTVIDDALQILHDKYGVKIGVIAGEKDGVFPARRLKRMEQMAFVDRFISMPIRHNGMYIKANEVVGQVVAMQRSFASEGSERK